MPAGGPVPRCWRHGRVVRQGSAKPCTPVRFRVPPLERDAKKRSLVRAISSGGERFLDAEEASGSNPLSPTLKIPQFAGKKQRACYGLRAYLGPLCSNRAATRRDFCKGMYKPIRRGLRIKTAALVHCKDIRLASIRFTLFHTRWFLVLPTLSCCATLKIGARLLSARLSLELLRFPLGLNDSGDGHSDLSRYAAL